MITIITTITTSRRFRSGVKYLLKLSKIDFVLRKYYHSFLLQRLLLLLFLFFLNVVEIIILLLLLFSKLLLVLLLLFFNNKNMLYLLFILLLLLLLLFLLFKRCIGLWKSFLFRHFIMVKNNNKRISELKYFSFSKLKVLLL